MNFYRILKIFSLLIAFLIIFYYVLTLFAFVILPVFKELLVPLISPYTFQLRLIAILITGYNLYSLIKNWNNINEQNLISQSSSNISQSNSIPYVHYWWVDFLRVLIIFITLLVSYVYYDVIKLAIYDYPISITLLYLFIIGFVVIFSNEYLNIHIDNNIPLFKFSHYSPKLGNRLDNHLNSNLHKIIKLLTNLNVLVYLLLVNEYTNNTVSIIFTTVYYINVYGFLISMVYFVLLNIMIFYMFILTLIYSPS